MIAGECRISTTDPRDRDEFAERAAAGTVASYSGIVRAKGPKGMLRAFGEFLQPRRQTRGSADLLVRLKIFRRAFLRFQASLIPVINDAFAKPAAAFLTASGRL